jgi:hypothetical protein
MPPSNTKPCHNCRRRRLRCDRSWPTCHKCAVSGQECLGYGKVFVWTQGIDSQGNVNPPPGRRLADDSDSSATASASPPGNHPGQSNGDRPRPQPQPDYSDQHPLARLVQQAQQAAQEAEDLNQSQQQRSAQNDDLPTSSDTMDWSPPTGALTDPLFQDLDHASRSYLAHCKSWPQSLPLPREC